MEAHVQVSNKQHADERAAALHDTVWPRLAAWVASFEAAGGVTWWSVWAGNRIYACDDACMLVATEKGSAIVLPWFEVVASTLPLVPGLPPPWTDTTPPSMWPADVLHARALLSLAMSVRRLPGRARLAWTLPHHGPAAESLARVEAALQDRIGTERARRCGVRAHAVVTPHGPSIIVVVPERCRHFITHIGLHTSRVRGPPASIAALTAWLESTLVPSTRETSAIMAAAIKAGATDKVAVPEGVVVEGMSITSVAVGSKYDKPHVVLMTALAKPPPALLARGFVGGCSASRTWELLQKRDWLIHVAELFLTTAGRDIDTITDALFAAAQGPTWLCSLLEREETD